MPTGGQPYCNPTTSIGTTPLYASEPAPLHENWGFQPDPNIEGHWTAVLQSRGPPPGRQQNAQMEYNMNYPEQPSEFQYQPCEFFRVHDSKFIERVNTAIRRRNAYFGTHAKARIFGEGEKSKPATLPVQILSRKIREEVQPQRPRKDA
ncbi:hypothetical protein PMZ80_008500 [Knufia obscura]|uniref:Uncharacterized protein n=1 Tax=Knufia obscura TaxID=1635080 RepID=A0ABR0REY7_9EURO|nr:hypothetical protein PMZ80_008500 [Knufia obscura]